MKYAIYDGFAVKMNEDEAWECVQGVWRELDTADATHKAKLLSEAEFNKLFPNLPQLPSTAFQAGPS